MTPEQRYQQDLQQPGFTSDPAQQLAVSHLQRLYQDYCAAINKKAGLLDRWIKKKNEPLKGVYFWGGVGRGKTYLVDVFFECLPGERKQRVHFHRFMRSVHASLDKHKGQKNPLQVIAKEFADQCDILCFDEFFVSDITDAMILAGLMEALFENGVSLVATSNIAPDGLYRNGLQRARFLPAIDLIKQFTEVVNVDGGVDYRLRALEKAEIYHSPLDQQAEKGLRQYFSMLAPEVGGRSQQALEVEGRLIDVKMAGDGVVWLDFHAICKTARSTADYIEIARCHHSVLVSGVEHMDDAGNDHARRFINMVDEFYDRCVKLIMSAEVPLDQLYSGKQLAFEFKRTRSRLQEMQSHEYLARKHLP
ncbi:cell division protein ZapE [Pelagibaculum spongiae]|uniref:Cell division protein ZapE n=1 Tax=Pelagibaculum spongiae TaxID=2080658 RepID=A0A2V1H1R3_9GAMM|nr:cell division protein ZapE [Pelagibaculum spongiae]PVZ71890.1 cell division protein ZapE [Pelagibaculum spongiae]